MYTPVLMIVRLLLSGNKIPAIKMGQDHSIDQIDPSIPLVIIKYGKVPWC